jgi:predicted ATPase
MIKLFAVSECSGGGKSTLLAALQKHGYRVVPEVGRQIVKQHADILTEDIKSFCELVVKELVKTYQKIITELYSSDEVVLFDRTF